jgi:signal transduction histidine kinase
MTQPSGLEAWQRSLPWWDLYFAVVAVATMVVVDSWFAVGFLVAMSVWYVLFGRKAMWGGCDDWVGVVYLVVAAVLLVPAVAYGSGASFILFALSPQGYMALGFRRGTVATVVLNLIPSGVDLLQGDDVRHSLPIALLAIVLSTIIGLSIDRLINQGVELAKSRAEVARLSRDAERQRIAADLHDTIAQGLSSIVMLIEAASNEEGEKAKRHLELAARTARENLQEVRAVLDALMPAQQDLGAVMQRLAQRFQEETGVTVTVETDATQRNVQTEVVLLRAVQESLSNVRKHANATTVHIRLSQDGLEVCDDGRGFQTDSFAGYGIQAMRDRVEQIGGAVAIESDQSGTKVRVRIPEQRA